ncbi:MAG TPA: AI-2E family transporter [Burkholderiaceae bacterium]|nr:AI-2E family transporter [Burkholderiaceae bacterium]
MSEPTNEAASPPQPQPSAAAASQSPAAPTGARVDRDRSQERWAAALWVGLGLALALAFFYFLAPVLTPFAFGGVLAYLLQPGTNWLQRRGAPRWLASALMLLLAALIAIGLLLILLPVLEREIRALNEQLPAVVSLLDARLSPLLQRWLGAPVRFDVEALRALALEKVEQQDVVSMLLSKFGTGGLALLQALITLLLIPVVLFYLLLDAPGIKVRLEAGLPRRWHDQTIQILADIDAVLAQFLRGQLTVMVLMAVYYSVALTIAGLDSALPIGILTGLLIFIPYVGYFLGLVLACLVALLQFASWQAIVEVLLVYGIGQILEGFFLTPRLVGARIGLHPLAVIFALLAFGHVFGFFGVLLALPASAVLLVALRRIRRRYVDSAFYNRR